jgi:hypothetical protein
VCGARGGSAASRWRWWPFGKLPLLLLLLLLELIAEFDGRVALLLRVLLSPLKRDAPSETTNKQQTSLTLYHLNNVFVPA